MKKFFVFALVAVVVLAMATVALAVGPGKTVHSRAAAMAR